MPIKNKPVLDCRPLNGESGVDPFRMFLLGGATGAEASPFGGNGGRMGAGCSVMAFIIVFKKLNFIIWENGSCLVVVLSYL